MKTGLGFGYIGSYQTLFISYLQTFDLESLKYNQLSFEMNFFSYIKTLIWLRMYASCYIGTFQCCQEALVWNTSSMGIDIQCQIPMFVATKLTMLKATPFLLPITGDVRQGKHAMDWLWAPLFALLGALCAVAYSTYIARCVCDCCVFLVHPSVAKRLANWKGCNKQQYDETPLCTFFVLVKIVRFVNLMRIWFAVIK